MLSRSADVGVRIAIGVVGVASIAGIFFLLDGDSGLAPLARVVLTIPLGGAFVFAIAAVSELRDSYEQREVLRFRRWGRRPVVVSDIEGASVTRYRRPQVYSTAPARRFSIGWKGTAFAFAVGALMAAVSWVGVADAAESGGLVETGLILACALPIGLWLSVRALIRLALSHRAVTVDSSALTLGISLGFAWPVRLPLSEIEEVVLFDAERGVEIIIGMRDDRSFRIDGRRLRDAPGFSAWWAENTASGQTFASKVEPIPQVELDPPIAPQAGLGPGLQRIDDLGAAMRRRTLVTMAWLTLASLFAAGTAYAYMDQRLENDHLAMSGSRYLAEVTDVDRSSRGPDEISVRFVANGSTYERTITSPWFKGYSRDLKGRNVTVLFDPSQEGMARLPESRNYPVPLRLTFLAVPLVLPLAIMSYRTNRWHNLALKHGQWTRAQVRIGKGKQKRAYIRRASDTETHTAYIFFHQTGQYEGGEAWVCGHNRGLLVVFDDQDDWLPASVGKKSSLRQPVKT